MICLLTPYTGIPCHSLHYLLPMYRK